MKTGEAIRKRRSVRHFSTKKVKWKDIIEILDAAKYAPMAGNIFSPRFVITTDQKKKADVATYCLEQYFIQDATYVIIVCSDLSQLKPLYGELSEEYGTKQASAAIQNMLLQATDLGLASCWIGSFDDNAIRSIFKIPEDLVVEAVIAIGYAGRKEKVPSKGDLNRHVFFEEYGRPEGWKDRDTLFWSGTRENRLEP